MSVTLREKNLAKFNLSKTYRDENWYGGIADYIYGKYAELAYRVEETFRYVAPDPSINRYTHSPEYANIIREAGTIFDSTMRNLITQSGNSNNFDCKIHGFLSFLKKYDPYLEERPVLFHKNKTHKYIFPFERSALDDTKPNWWIAYTNLKHREIEAYREGNFENTLNSVAAVAILSGYIKPRGGSIIFANTGLINVNMERLFFIARAQFEMIVQCQFSRGIKLCYENAKRLNNLSKKYFQKKLYEGSFFLSFAAWEEIGKAIMILEKKLDDEPISKTDWKKRLKSHSIKIKKAHFVHDLNLIESTFGTEYADKFRSGEFKLMIDEEFLEKMANYRLGGVYVNYVFKIKEWELPMDFSDELAFSVYRIAAQSIGAFKMECNRADFNLNDSS